MPEASLELGEFAPDLYPGTGGASPVCANLIPAKRGYYGVPSPQPVTTSDLPIVGEVNSITYDISSTNLP